MKIRKLEQQEHGKTRKLWEEVFTEDSKDFLDYYYYIKARDNEIFTVEEDGDIQSMLQLNPYEISIEGKIFPSCYIIAVATRREYRGRGYMRELLYACLKEMYDRKIPFTFLMPAAAAIYTPYDFRYIYDQKIDEIEKKKEVSDDTTETSIVTKDACLFDAEKMAAFFKEYFSEVWQVYAAHNAEYYRTMVMEQQSEHGGVRLMKAGEKIVGLFAYAKEEETEIREPLYLARYETEFRNAVRELATDAQERIKVSGSAAREVSGYKPLIMARIVCLRELLSALLCRTEEELKCSFAVIDPIIHQNSRIWKLLSPEGESGVSVEETEDSEGIIPVAELTEFLFGRIGTEELQKREGVILTERLNRELKKIQPLSKTFFNEVV